MTTVILTHVNSISFLLRNLLQLPLRTRGTTEICQTTDHAQHGGQGDDAGFLAQGGVRADAEGDVGFQGTVEADFAGLGEDLGVVVGVGLFLLAKAYLVEVNGEENLQSQRRLCRQV